MGADAGRRIYLVLGHCGTFARKSYNNASMILVVCPSVHRSSEFENFRNSERILAGKFLLVSFTE
jgi:hypothetical protein